MNLTDILNSVIKQSFPELMDEDIRVEWKKLDNALMTQGGLTGHGYFIEVDKSLKESTENIVIGGFVHELCHILDDIKLGKKRSLTDRISYLISTRYKTLDERNTDIQAIIRGYGNELLDFMKYAEKSGFEYYKEDGLSIREIESILTSHK